MFLRFTLVLVLLSINICRSWNVKRKIELTSNSSAPDVTVGCHVHDNAFTSSFQLLLKYNDEMVAAVRYQKDAAIEYKDTWKHGHRSSIRFHFDMSKKRCSVFFTLNRQYKGVWSCETETETNGTQTEEGKDNLPLRKAGRPKGKLSELKQETLNKTLTEEGKDKRPLRKARRPKEKLSALKQETLNKTLTEEGNDKLQLRKASRPKVKVFELKGDEISSNRYLEGASIIPECAVPEGFPQATVRMTYRGGDMKILMKRDEKKNENKDLEVRYSAPRMKLEDTDDGSLITCRVNNSVGDDELARKITVLYSVREMKLKRRNAGTEIRCTARGNPPPAIEIIVESLKNVPERKPLSERGSAEATLKIPQSTASGNYLIRCEANNTVINTNYTQRGQLRCSWRGCDRHGDVYPMCGFIKSCR